MSKIAWTDKTWNSVTGCTKVSAGCANCYAERMHRRLAAMGQEKYAQPFSKVVVHPDSLDKPLHWRKPRTIFVNSMSDLFHPDVPFEFIDQVFAVMALCPQHCFQILSKRTQRLAEYLTCDRGRYKFETDHTTYAWWVDLAARDLPFQRPEVTDFPHPLPNVWLGVSVENQATTNERIPHLLKCPAAVRFLSLEPMLGPINLDSDDADGCHALGCGHAECECGNRGIDWLIVGCESGPGRRPFELDWARSVRDQCQAAGVPLFIKQLPINGKVSTDPAEWPEDLRVQQWPKVKA